VGLENNQIKEMRVRGIRAHKISNISNSNIKPTTKRKNMQTGKRYEKPNS